MRKTIVIAFIAALCAPAAAVADDPAPSQTPQQTANQMCKAELQKLGSTTFKQTYGNKPNAWGKCVSKNATLAQHAADNAAKACKAERASLGADAFATKYGTNAKGKNGGGKNAFGKCVSQKAKERTDAEAQETISAAKACKTERTTNPAAFAQKYGTFGKCVAAKSQSQ